MSRRRRLDAELVRRELATSRSQAQELIAARRVRVGGAVADKAARQVDPGDAVEVVGDPPRFVSRGGRKLEAALARFTVDLADRRVIDAGSSTGGFTDCALQHGAARVVAIDVGRNQLHERLREDPRVDVHEQTNVRDLEPASVGGPGDVLVGDLSFISLRTVLDSLLALVVDGGDLVVLVKPQFEAGKADADRGRGVIRDPQIWRRTVLDVGTAFEERAAAIMDVMVSPITGGDGNVEFLLHARRGADAPVALDELVDRVLGEVESAHG
ncbi:MAG: TlyA family RNA methyltransferase [Acidimicrobiales bacterium]|nr:TlyA family RNA methyltransferase [Acidimicrobiales bacterium]